MDREIDKKVGKKSDTSNVKMSQSIVVQLILFLFPFLSGLLIKEEKSSN